MTLINISRKNRKYFVTFFDLSGEITTLEFSGKSVARKWCERELTNIYPGAF